ncbi:hypothetical protein [Micromonospora sp. MA102]|uniref:hypothetical protein n=1 Tax=Micromonospora sp. MA102 TaxID=2952755 RepID=UPI0021C91DFC|nr:hypothetical protein [Micromonospora sp. MA102]
MIYDPDGDPDAFDPNDLDVVNAYLDNPTVKALHEDLGGVSVGEVVASGMIFYLWRMLSGTWSRPGRRRTCGRLRSR